MRSVLCGFALGVAALQQCAVLPLHWICVWGCLIAIAGMVWVGFCPISPAARVAITLLCAMGFGFGWAGWRAHQRLAFYLPAEFEQRVLWIEGDIVSIPTVSATFTRFIFDITPPKQRVSPPALFPTAIPSFFPTRIQLSGYAQPEQSMPLIRVGERWRFKVKLTRIHGSSNPYGSDFEAMMLEQNIRARGVILNQVAPVFLGQSTVLRNQMAQHKRGETWLKTGFYSMAQWRQSLQERINEVLDTLPHKGVITALAIGLQTDINSQDLSIFRRTGTSHLVAISGLHIALAAGFVGKLMASLWRWLAYFGFRGPLWIPAPKIAALSGIVAGLAYAALSGMGVPAQRAVIMLSVLSMAILSGREITASLKLAWALAVVLFIDPWAVISASFWHSFGAVAMILLSMRSFEAKAYESIRQYALKCRHAIAEMIHLQFSVTLGLIPLSALWFNQVSLVSPLANILAIPWVSFTVVPLVLVGIVLPKPFDAWALCWAHASFAGLSRILESVSTPLWALQSLPSPGVVSLISAAVGMLLWVEWPMAVCHRLKRALPGRQLALKAISLSFFIPLRFSFEPHPAAGEFRITALDVGQGAAALIETQKHRLLFDTGPSYASSWGKKSSYRVPPTLQLGLTTQEPPDAGQRIIVPYLQARGIRRLDGLIISHADTDHSGGAQSVLGALPVSWFRASLPKRHALWQAVEQNQRRAQFPVAMARCQAGERWVWEGVTFTFLWPDDAKRRGTRNAGSCVLRVENAQHAALLAADIETPQERQLVARQRDTLRADVLLAPHHGSRTSSSPAFLYAVGANEVIFQMGYLNRFGHPHPAVVRRYQRYGIKQHRSDWHGALIFESVVGKVKRYRSERRRYWFHR